MIPEEKLSWVKLIKNLYQKLINNIHIRIQNQSESRRINEIYILKQH